MKRLFLDSSAYVKIFSPEEGSQTVQKLLEAGKEGKAELVVSSWTINEAVAALDRKARRREITQQGRDKAGLRKKGKLIDIRDMFVGCICKTNKMPLLTRNIKHYQRIPGLAIITSEQLVKSLKT